MRLTCEKADFQSTLNVARIAEGNVCSGIRIELKQAADFFLQRCGVQFSPHRRVAGGQGIEPVGQGFDVETRAARDDGDATASSNVRQNGEGKGAVALGIAAFGEGEGAVEMVARSMEIACIGLSREDIQPGEKLE